MPKVIEYPRASFVKAKELADTVEALGGSSSAEMCASKLGKQHTSGAFAALVSSSVKFGLIENKRGSLVVTERYKQIKYAYTPEERQRLLQEAFLLPQVFKALVERFKGRELPIGLLDKMLIREFDVDEGTASRVAGYFIDGLKEFGLMDAGNLVRLSDQEGNAADTQPQKAESESQSALSPPPPASLASSSQNISVGTGNEYTVRFSGPGLDHTFVIADEEDFEMIGVLLKKVKKALAVIPSPPTEISNA